MAFPSLGSHEHSMRSCVQSAYMCQAHNKYKIKVRYYYASQHHSAVVDRQSLLSNTHFCAFVGEAACVCTCVCTCVCVVL